MMPELTASTGAPRIAAVERPFGLTLGLPGDADGQLAVLLGALRALSAAREPGGVVDLQLNWSYEGKLNWHPSTLPPIVNYLRRRPWAFTRFLNRTPPN